MKPAQLYPVITRIQDACTNTALRGILDERHVAYLNVINRICETMKSSDLAILPESLISELHQKLTTVMTLISHTSFDALRLAAFDESYGYFVETTTRALLILGAMEQTSVKNIIEEVTGLKIQIINEISELGKYKKIADETSKDMFDLLESTKNAAQEVVAAKFHTLYQKRRNYHARSSIIWLIGLLLSVIGTGIIAFIMLQSEQNFILQNKDILKYPAAFILIIGVRLVIFSALFLLITVCIKNYRANKHNQIINENRQNALDSFSAFIKSADKNDKQIKDAILMEATRTIFSNPPTGFIDESDNDSAKVFEVIKNVTNLPSK